MILPATPLTPPDDARKERGERRTVTGGGRERKRREWKRKIGEEEGKEEKRGEKVKFGSGLGMRLNGNNKEIANGTGVQYLFVNCHT